MQNDVHGPAEEPAADAARDKVRDTDCQQRRAGDRLIEEDDGYNHHAPRAGAATGAQRYTHPVTALLVSASTGGHARHPNRAKAGAVRLGARARRNHFSARFSYHSEMCLRGRALLLDNGNQPTTGPQNVT